MWIHKDVYDVFYDALFIYYINIDVLSTEGYNAKGKRYSLDSDEWWTISRTENNKTYYLAQRILKGLSSCDWQYYRLKTNYNSKTPDKVKVNGKYQDIDMRYFTNGLTHIGYVLPENCRIDQYHGIYEQIKGQALLNVFLRQPKYAHLLGLYPELNFFDYAEIVKTDASIANVNYTVRTSQSTKTEIQISVFDIARKLNFYNDFLYEICRQFVFEYTHPGLVASLRLFSPNKCYSDVDRFDFKCYGRGDLIILIDTLFISEPSYTVSPTGTMRSNCELLYIEHVYRQVQWNTNAYHISTPDKYVTIIIPEVYPFKQMFIKGCGRVSEFEKRLIITKEFKGYKPDEVRIKSFHLSFERQKNEWFIVGLFKNEIENQILTSKVSGTNEKPTEILV